MVENTNTDGMWCEGVVVRQPASQRHSCLQLLRARRHRTACWRVRVIDECDQPVPGAQVEARGVNHGYFTQTITNEDGLGCIEVGRSESMGQDFDGDLLSNELFDVEIKGQRVLGQVSLAPPMSRIESTPNVEGSCRELSSCDDLTLSYMRCIDMP